MSMRLYAKEENGLVPYEMMLAQEGGALRGELGRKLNAANVVNNLTTTAAGYALDARQGKALGDKLAGKANGGWTLLWDGTWSSGSIYLPGIADWAVLAVGSAIGGVGLSGLMFGKMFPVAIQHVGQDNRIYSVTCVMNIAGNYLTFGAIAEGPAVEPKYYSHDPGGGHSAWYATAIKTIWGVIKK